jgi:hypothetical protein
VPSEDAADRAEHAQQRAALNVQRAAQAAARAARHEALMAAAPDSLRPLHARLGALYRQVERRHLVSAEINRQLAVRINGWLSHPDGALTPVFLAAVAGMLGAPSALVVLRGQRAVITVRASDGMARAAQDLETVLAEGPALEAARSGVPVMAAGTALLDRWPRYGPAAAELGVAAVMAAPLGPPAARLGALCALDRVPTIPENAALTLRDITAALTRVLLDGARPGTPADLAVLPLIGAEDTLAVVHQAAGMVSVQCGCSVDDAADLLAARAFAEGLPLAEIALRVVSGQTHLADL